MSSVSDRQYSDYVHSSESGDECTGRSEEAKIHVVRQVRRKNPPGERPLDRLKFRCDDCIECLRRGRTVIIRTDRR